MYTADVDGGAQVYVQCVKLRQRQTKRGKRNRSCQMRPRPDPRPRWMSAPRL